MINPATEGGFENGADFASNGWMLDNGTVTNKWYVGTVPTGMTGNSAYVSADNGTTNGYTNSSISVVHFYRDVTFPAGESAIVLTFSYKSGGESSFWDGIIVSLAPTTYTPTATNATLGQNALGAPAIELARFWNVSGVTTATIVIPSSVAGNCAGASTMRLIFTWKNDDSAGSGATAIDNIGLVTQLPSINAAGGTYTIDNTQPTGGTNFASFTDAIYALNFTNTACTPLSGPIVFNVTAGQTFNELPPVITATGTAAATITFQKSGAGANPVISSVGTAATNDGSLVVAGGDYFTFDGIDINNSAVTSMEYGYLIRNASATNGAQNNTIRNATIQLNRNVTTSASSAILVSTTSTGGGVTATSADGANSNTTIQNIEINGAINGINLNGTSAYPDLASVIGTTSAGIRNAISNIGPTTSTFVSAAGILAANQSGFTIADNDISAVTSNQSAARGIFVSGNKGSSFVTGNKISAISNQGSTSTTSIAYGIQAQNNTSGTHNVRIANNMISNIYTSFTGTATASRYAIGIFTGVASANSSQSYDVYHNTVSIGEGLTPSYSTTCFEIQNVSAIYRVQNNIFANFTGAQTGAARHYTWVTTSATNIGASGSISDRNVLHIANGAGASGFTARASTTDLNTLANWTAAITAVPGTELNSANLDPAFVNNNTDLHLTLAVPSQVESGGANLGITVDIDGDLRPGPTGSVNGGATAPDMGADEFDGLPAPPPAIVLNSVTPPAATECTATARLISVDVTTPMGTVTSVALAYTVDGVAQTPVVMTNTSGSTYEGTIPAPTPVYATIAWSVGATNSFGTTATYLGTSYSDAPLTGVLSSVTSSVAGALCAGSPTTLTAELGTTVQIGNATTLTGATSQPTAFCNRWSSYRMQLLYTAAELTAAGLTAGPIGSIAFDISTLGDGASNSAFTVKVGSTALTAFTDFVSSTGFTTVLPATTYTHAIGLNTIDFATPYYWDGTSNVVFEVSHNGANLTNNARTYYTATTGNTVAWSTNGGSSATTSPNRLNIVIGTYSPAITGISWSDGSTTVGTSNPLVVSPTATTTYTATITAAGCTVSPNPALTVNVNPLPSAPVAANSSQCGTHVPTASVTSTTGAATPTFNWYDATTGGTLMQSGTSTTFTSDVTATTTFYVSEADGTTGCESPRTAVTVTVTPADAISADAGPATICIGSTITLTAGNTNPTPVQNYSFTWVSTTGSGAETPVTGASVTITPTAPGTYTYDLTGTDGGCSAVATASVTVEPFVTALTAVDATCNGVANGTFTQGASSCGTAPYTYGVDGGAFGPIPTDLGVGAHTVIVKDANGFTDTVSITISEPSTTITNPTASAITVCQDDPSAMVTATATQSTPLPGSIVVSFDVTAQPEETNSSPGNIVATATYSLPAGATVTGGTLAYDGLTALGSSWRSDIRLGFSGAVSNAAAGGAGAPNSSGTLNYTRAIPAADISVAGGTVNLLYWDYVSDNSDAEATFPTGTGVATLTINYATPTPATVSWWDAATGGTQIGTGSPFETVGTSVLPNTSTPGTYTVYAQGQNGACPSPGRTAVEITVNAASASSLTAAACDTYELNGTTYNASGVYTQVIPNAAGCDSTITLNLTITNSSTSSLTAAACSSYTLNGTTYNASGVYTQVFTNAAGCDSTLTLNLTINEPTASTITTAACSSYTLNGTTYNASGVYTQVIPNAAGCDSTITLNLTINEPTTASMTAEACSSYTLNGTTYNASGVYTQVIPNAAGCDSTITLNLTINEPTTASMTVSECESFTYNGTTYTASGVYTEILTNAAGCDSVVTIDLTILGLPNAVATDNGDLTITASAGTSYQWVHCATGLPITGATSQTFTATVNGSYAVVVTNAEGCSDTSNCVTIADIGIDELAGAGIRVFPNPTNNDVTVTLTSADATIEVADAKGTLLQTLTIQNGEKVSLSGYETGVYFLRIRTANGSAVERIVKN